MLPYFSDKGKDNGWYADAFIRMYLSKMGLKLVHNQRDDDLFLLLVSIFSYFLLIAFLNINLFSNYRMQMNYLYQKYYFSSKYMMDTQNLFVLVFDGQYLVSFGSKQKIQA